MKIAFLSFVLVLGSVQANASSPFDGKWTGGSPPGGTCPGALTLDLTIENGMISGEIASNVPNPQGYTRGRLYPAGVIGADGTVSLTVGTATHYPGAARFTGDRFVLNFNGPCGTRTITGARAK